MKNTENTSLEDVFGPVISCYSRAQAIEDGVLVDVTNMAREAGFKWPVALTHADGVIVSPGLNKIAGFRRIRMSPVACGTCYSWHLLPYARPLIPVIDCASRCIEYPVMVARWKLRR